MKKYTITQKIRRDPSTFLNNNKFFEVLKRIAVIIGNIAISIIGELINRYDDKAKKEEGK
ncbi:MAG: hypothetical protein IKG98_03090 [Ruminococcus sp.]|nr:hypothetical protein [Ruminococcus sp.]